MKKLFDNALEVHEELRGEKITKAYLAAKLWPNSLIQTQRNNFSSLQNGKTRLHKDQIVILCQELPDTNADYWCNLIPYDRELSIFKSMYTVDKIDANPELALLYQLICEEKYCDELYNNWL